MKNSVRHHYIPQCLIKNFLNENDETFVYDKITNKYYETSSHNLFLENNRNTFEGNDNIEKMYSYFDNFFGPVLKNVADSGVLGEKDLDMLLFIAYSTKWRVPQYDESFNDAKNYFSFEDLKIRLEENDVRVEYFIDPIKDKEEYQEMKRILLAAQTFRYKDNYNKIYKNSFLIHTQYPALLGDCPFNELQMESDIVFEDFIFPISNDLTLVHMGRIKKDELNHFLQNNDPSLFLELFSTFRDLGTIFLATRTVCCSDKDYLKKMIDHYNKVKDMDTFKGKLSSYIFNVLYNFNNLEQYIK